MGTTSEIASVELHDEGPLIATVTLSDGARCRPTWRSLRDYWSYAGADEVEYSACSVAGASVLFCLTTASGQGGILAVLDCTCKRWLHVSAADHVICGMILGDLAAIVSLHYVSCWGVPGHHMLFVSPLDKTLDGFLDASTEIRCRHSNRELSAVSSAAMQVAYARGTPDTHDPIGVFRLADGETFVAHDAGNLWEFSASDVTAALEKRRAEDAARKASNVRK